MVLVKSATEQGTGLLSALKAQSNTSTGPAALQLSKTQNSLQKSPSSLNVYRESAQPTTATVAETPAVHPAPRVVLQTPTPQLWQARLKPISFKKSLKPLSNNTKSSTQRDQAPPLSHLGRGEGRVLVRSTGSPAGDTAAGLHRHTQETVVGRTIVARAEPGTAPLTHQVCIPVARKLAKSSNKKSHYAAALSAVGHTATALTHGAGVTAESD